MPLAWHTIHYPTLAAYEAALLPFHKPAWIRGITLHHTWKPTRAQWRGKRSMDTLERYYRGLGWSGGPHLFVAADVPQGAGIWAGTPLAVPGVHAGACNSSHIGIEIVGNYDLEPWPPAVAELVYGLTRLLMRWGKIPATRVQGHRECLPNKSCPGWKIDMKAVRARLARG